jgi:hypothetical protein
LTKYAFGCSVTTSFRNNSVWTTMKRSMVSVNKSPNDDL